MKWNWAKCEAVPAKEEVHESCGIKREVEPILQNGKRAGTQESSQESMQRETEPILRAAKRDGTDPASRKERCNRSHQRQREMQPMYVLYDNEVYGTVTCARKCNRRISNENATTVSRLPYSSVYCRWSHGCKCSQKEALKVRQRLTQQCHQNGQCVWKRPWLP